nr:PREDICTED: zinc transporter ZIP1-like [Bemisia tabaci]
MFQGQLDRERDAESEADACSRCLSAGAGAGEGGGLHVSEQLRLSRGQRKKSVLVVLALSFHSVFEGMAIGLERNLDDARYLFAAVALHESTMLFCIGLEMVASQAAPTPTATIVLNLAALALVSPLGVVIGTLLTLNQEDMDSYSQRIVIGTLQGLAAGTILYVTFFEMLDKQRTQETGIVRATFILCGFIIMLFFSVRGGHTHARLDEKNLFSPCNYSNDQQEPQIKR